MLLRRNNEPLQGLEIGANLVVVGLQLFVGHFVRIAVDILEITRTGGQCQQCGRQTIDAQKWYQAIGAQSGLPQYYTYSATNFRLQELSLGYTLPSKWFRDKMRMTVSFVGRNLWMIYCKAPFDPEAVASTGLNYQGIDYFMMPSLRSLGFNVKFQF